MRNSGFIALICSVVCLASCGLCSDALKSSAVSPDGRLVANVSERNCGATTDFVTRVNVQSRSERFHPDEGLVFVASGSFDVSVAWTGARTLVINCPRCSRHEVARQVVVLGSIDVAYKIGTQ